MNSKKLKLLIISVFLAFAAFTFFVPNDKIEAQTNENLKKKAKILKKVADYKTWNQVNKPDKKTDSDILTIAESTAAG